MQILLRHNRSFEITNNSETLQFNETEELSFTFVEKLSQFLLEDGTFSFSFPFDMIEVLFEYQKDGIVIIGTQMYDKTERQELLLNARDFFLTLTKALYDYFKHIEKSTPLENYIIDNNPQRNKNRKWKWAMYHQLDKNFCGRKVAILTIEEENQNWKLEFFECYQLVKSFSPKNSDELISIIEEEAPIYLTIQTNVAFLNKDLEEYLYYNFGFGSKNEMIEIKQILS